MYDITIKYTTIFDKKDGYHDMTYAVFSAKAIDDGLLETKTSTIITVPSLYNGKLAFPK